MDAKLKADWVKALRSGKYSQAKDALKCGGGFCCLGVLADIQGAVWNSSSSPIINGAYANMFDEEFLCSSFAGGLSETRQKTLAKMNDGGESFAAIADHIEANIPADEPEAL